MSPSDPFRPRSPTIPPVSMGDLPLRVRDLEHRHDTQARGLEDMAANVKDMADSLKSIELTITVITAERSNEQKRRDHLMKWIVGVAIGVSVAALGTMAGWVIHLQSALAR